ncbi:Putative Poly(3-hydroxybutyrate) depolymerase [Tolypocladium paradoxum]|uniref:Poly(3-hydroxybutyrate) depolymerase n=1 Tax=Tolypocladium paradoxum TaxID=94208 RepID=A0A2S4LAR0_9HYPO|nr:Putative Poly(3-hydroxybutyrate) depolymerase [Tolypocladium paradoxum]
MFGVDLAAPADTNGIIVLYPQAMTDYTPHTIWARTLLPNPNACFDWVGWYGMGADQNGVALELNAQKLQSARNPHFLAWLGIPYQRRDTMVGFGRPHAARHAMINIVAKVEPFLLKYRTQKK